MKSFGAELRRELAELVTEGDRVVIGNRRQRFFEIDFFDLAALGGSGKFLQSRAAVEQIEHKEFFDVSEFGLNGDDTSTQRLVAAVENKPSGRTSSTATMMR